MNLPKIVLTIALLCLIGCNPQATKPELVASLPADICNCPDGCTLSSDGDIILSIPNFNNGALIKSGELKKEQPAFMMQIDKNNKMSTWYKFKPADLHPETKKVGPMDCAFGPDGNLYFADNQLFYNNKHKSRLMRINVKNGKPVSTDVVAEGFICSNAVVWQGDTIYVSETMLQNTVVKEGQKKPALISGVYAIGINEWKKGPVKLQPYTATKHDPHLIAEYKTSNRIGFGADGICFDEEGNLYCGIFEDGIIYKTSFKNGKAQPAVEFAKDPKMACCDGIVYRKKDKKIYVADMLINGVQAVAMDGTVTTIHKNSDTDGADGSLDQPCEVMLRGDELIIINMDMPWDSPLLTNKKIDKPYTVSGIQLP